MTITDDAIEAGLMAVREAIGCEVDLDDYLDYSQHGEHFGSASVEQMIRAVLGSAAKEGLSES